MAGPILSKALKLAPELGWSPKLVSRLKDEFGVVEMTRHYPNGLIDLAKAWANWADQEMLAAMQDAPLNDMKIREKIAFGVKARLTALTPHKRAFIQSFKYMMHPVRGLQTKKLTWQTADRLWYAAGDDATDYNHYTKRMLLSGVLASTTLYWMRDTSDDHNKTWEFLDRRISDVLKIGGFMARLKNKRRG